MLDKENEPLSASLYATSIFEHGCLKERPLVSLSGFINTHSPSIEFSCRHWPSSTDIKNKALSASPHASASLDAKERIFDKILEDQEAMFVCAARCRKILDTIEKGVRDDLLQAYGVQVKSSPITGGTPYFQADYYS
ncbi:hypothetical protein SCLCIDRAFT_29938 [Scleroderma citrinum Foug A]|uniref:Uncharacterized protein n=1 Tax=Scleroderma citrinum Foug A TaxID=1036808 RepID=A0A0C3DI63_9AGAM|nr:hypothetical protein SCLCIDRAFT_29938 [Scleroderma citrinum Foug A]